MEQQKLVELSRKVGCWGNIDGLRGSSGGIKLFAINRPFRVSLIVPKCSTRT